MRGPVGPVGFPLGPDLLVVANGGVGEDGMAGAARGSAQHGTVIARAIRERKEAG